MKPAIASAVVAIGAVLLVITLTFLALSVFSVFSGALAGVLVGGGIGGLYCWSHNRPRRRDS
jgi:hypothetical protein